MSAIRDTPITDPSAWRADTLLPNDRLHRLSDACLAELDTVATELQANPLPVEALKADDLDMPACRAAMGDVCAQLHDGIGFQIIDRLPLDAYTEAVAVRL